MLAREDQTLKKIHAEKLQIPHFQRGYVWKAKNWEQFWNTLLEIEENGKSFIGILIVKQITIVNVKSEKKIKVNLLVDGQQRITTMLLLLKALALKQKDLENTFAHFFTKRPDGIFLEHNYRDKDVFEKIITAKSEKDFEKEKDNKGIPGAYNFFANKIRKKVEEEGGTDKLEKLFDVCLDNLLFVSIELDNEDDEQYIFETLNDFGVRLTATELIKNFLFKRGDEDSYEKNWAKVFEEGEKGKYWDYEYASKRSNIDLFLYSALLALSEGNEKYLVAKHLFTNYKHFVQSKDGYDDASLVIELKKLAGFYEPSMKPLCEKTFYQTYSKNISSDLWRLNLIIFGSNIRAVVPYLLYILKNADKAQHTSMFALLESCLMRRHICGIGSTPLAKACSRFIQSKIDNYNKLRYELGKLTDDERFPNDNELKDKFPYPRSNTAAKLILYLIEMHDRNGKEMESLTPLKDCEVEHLMPKAWKEKDYPLKDSYTKEERNDIFIPQIGNLTIVNKKLNLALSNKAWAHKRKELNEYSKGIRITSDRLTEEKWLEPQIEKWTEQLYQKAIKAWPALVPSKVEETQQG